MINIKDLHVKVDDKLILKGLDLNVNEGELHVIMGKNGTGKSTLANVIAGKTNYDIVKGSIKYKNENLIDMIPEDRACKGLFLSFQYPVAIPGVNNMYFLKAALNSIKKFNGQDEIDAVEFLAMMKEKLKQVSLDESFIHRAVNDGFSGGEKKRNEILQMITLEPKFSILDETDSGLDIDALKIISEGINKFRNKDRSFLLITHYQRMLDYLNPDFVHILHNGKIIKSGNQELALKLEKEGYSWLDK